MAVTVHCRYIKMLLQDFVNKFWKKNVSECILEKVDKEKFVTLSRFCPLRVSGVWSWMNPLKKENLRRKSFSNEWSSKKLWKIISTDIKTDVKQEINKLLAVSYNFS